MFFGWGSVEVVRRDRKKIRITPPSCDII